MPAIARLPGFAAALDAKRIAATSLAIAVHAAVLMLLLMPMQAADPPQREDEPMVVLEIKPLPKPIEPPPRPQPPRPLTRQPEPTRAPVPVEVLNTDPRPVDDFVEAVTLDEPPAIGLDVEPQPSFASIQADVSPAPPYPAQALRLQQAGRVLLRVRVDAQGRPAEIAIERSSGFRLLDEAAVKAVRKRWHFVPATQDGRPVEAWALVPIVFQIDR
jgi:protein TonB